MSLEKKLKDIVKLTLEAALVASFLTYRSCQYFSYQPSEHKARHYIDSPINTQANKTLPRA